MHGKIKDMPEADILIHAGDFTSVGERADIISFNSWLGKQTQYKHIIVIAGNHDKSFESAPQVSEALMTNCTYLKDSHVMIDGFKIYGSPWQPMFFNWAFNVPRDLMWKKWELIPDDTDILITHGPAEGYGGMTSRGEEAGCAALRQKLLELKPLAHICGHIHEGYGVYNNGYTQIVNASTCGGRRLERINAPIVIEVEK
jgi:Icc-related predicted phosphoesterase